MAFREWAPPRSRPVRVEGRRAPESPGRLHRPLAHAGRLHGLRSPTQSTTPATDNDRGEFDVRTFLWLACGCVAFLLLLWLAEDQTVPPRPSVRTPQADSLPEAHVEPVATSRSPVAGTEYLVRVRSENGRPVSNATCRAFRGDAECQLADTPPTAQGATDETGQCRLAWDTAPGTLSVRAEGYQQATVPLASVTEVVLRPGAHLDFRCVDEEGAPLQGVQIAVSTQPLPDLATISADAQPGFGPKSIDFGTTDEHGTIHFSTLSPSTYFYAAGHPSRLSQADGWSSFTKAPSAQPIVITLSSPWVAGVQFVGDGETVFFQFTYSGSLGNTRSTLPGRRLHRELLAKYPDAVLASAMWDGPTTDRIAVLTAWHTRLGWYVDRIPFQHIDRFVPVMIDASHGAAVEPASVRLLFEDPTGGPLALDGCSLRAGHAYGTPFGEDITAKVPADLRTSMNFRKSVGSQPTKVPPGHYRLVVPDNMLASLMKERHRFVDAAPGQEISITVPLTARASHARIQIESANPAVDWTRANVAILIDGKQVSARVLQRRPADNLLPPPIVPHDTPFELEVKCPEFETARQPYRITAESDVLRVVLQPK